MLSGDLSVRSCMQEVGEGSWIEHLGIRPFFQPIVDLTTGLPIGYEVLSRGTPPFEAPTAMFDRARELDCLWDLERACRAAAIRKISTLEPRRRSSRFFLNVSPRILSDSRFLEGFTLAALKAVGLDQDHIVIEITEKESIVDYGHFEELIRHYSDQGFRIALDDFGSGHSSLVTLVRCTPNFLKLDHAIVQDVDRTPYKQQLVKALVAFSASVDAKLIAEGVETWKELEALVRLGVRYAQGFLFARPGPEPVSLPEDVRERLARTLRGVEGWEGEQDDGLRSLIGPCTAVEAGTLSVEELDHLFRHSPAADHVVVVRDRIPVGLVTRIGFYGKTAGPFGYPVFQKKPVDALAKTDPLLVEERTRITTLHKLAMSRMPEDVYDPVLVVDEDGLLLGTVTIRQLIQRSTELEIQWASGANPLTGLPGNPVIQRWIIQAVATPPFSLVYADLDRFKEYNDRYGFLNGDELIRATGRLLSKALGGLPVQARLGHLGGDDFVMVCDGLLGEGDLDGLCREFDRLRLELFDPCDRDRGWFPAADRRGCRVEVPLTTLSLAVLDSRAVPAGLPVAQLAQIAAAVKATAKRATEKQGRSAYVFEPEMV